MTAPESRAPREGRTGEARAEAHPGDECYRCNHTRRSHHSVFGCKRGATDTPPCECDAFVEYQPPAPPSVGDATPELQPLNGDTTMTTPTTHTLTLPAAADENFAREAFADAMARRIRECAAELDALGANLLGSGIVSRSEFNRAFDGVQAMKVWALPVLEYAKAFDDQWPATDEDDE